MVRIKALSFDQLTAKMSVLHCLMMSHGDELLARYHGLLQSNHEYLSASDASFAKSKAKGKEMKKNIKSLTKSLDNLHAEVAYLFADLNWATILEAEKIYEHATEPLSVILQLKPEKLARPANVLASRDACVSHPIAKESTVTLASTSLELLSNIVPTSYLPLP
ncbi:hypothetical protein Tco_1475842 [Tanacetum coccineum]